VPKEVPKSFIHSGPLSGEILKMWETVDQQGVIDVKRPFEIRKQMVDLVHLYTDPVLVGEGNAKKFTSYIVESGPEGWVPKKREFTIPPVQLQVLESLYLEFPDMVKHTRWTPFKRNK
jgi:hypothetical protein